MKITGLRTLRVPPCWVWLEVHTDEGIVGLGEPYLENHPEAVIAEVERLEPLLLGRDPRDIEALWRELYESVFYYRGGPVTMSAISGIDIALWDIAGKAAGLPVHRLLGGPTRDRVPLYVGFRGGPVRFAAPGDGFGYTVSRPGGVAELDPDAWRRATRERLDLGFRCLKLHFPLDPTLAGLEQVDDVIAIVAAVREEAGPQVPVAVDLHFPHPKVAAQIIDGLAPLRPLWVEDPQQIESFDVLADLTRSTSLPIAASHAWTGKWQFLDALRAGLAVVQPDLLHVGGITEGKKVAALAEAFHADVAPHTACSVIGLAASLQLDACIPNFLVQEHNEILDSYVDGRVLVGAGYVTEPFELDDDGCIAIPQGPGLGIELDDDALAEIMAKPWTAGRA